MTVRWCSTHQSSFDEPEDSMCLKASFVDDAWRTDCLAGEMQLVSVDALVIEKVDGEWPDWAAHGTWEATSRTLDALLLLAVRESADA